MDEMLEQELYEIAGFSDEIDPADENHEFDLWDEDYEDSLLDEMERILG